MTGISQFIRLGILVTVVCGCSANIHVGTSGRGEATAEVAGLKIEAELPGKDGGDVSIDNSEEGVWNVAIGGVDVVVKRRDDGALDLQIDGGDYGSANEGDHLLIDRNRNVFLNDQPLASQVADLDEQG